MNCHYLYSLSVVATCFTACQSPQPEVPTAKTAATAAAVVASSSAALRASGAALAPPVSTAPATAWTDPRVIAELAKDCKYVPLVDISDGNVNSDVAGDPFTCTQPSTGGGFSDACEGALGTCAEACKKSCGGCGDGCSAQCGTCKATCTTDACKAACATTCASCKQSCFTGQTTCDASKCSAPYDKCVAERRATFRKPGCIATCENGEKCRQKCGDSPTAYACRVACDQRLNPTKSACLQRCARETPDADYRNICPTKCDVTACSAPTCVGGVQDAVPAPSTN
jgi:hypothetical protein